jgi:hypothetical protein
MKFSRLHPRLFLLVMLAALSCMARADLLVTDNTNHRVLRYSNAGVALGTFITSGSVAQIVSTPVFGPDGNLYFLDLQNEVLRFNGSTGAFIDTFVPGSSGLLPTALTFGPDGNLYVADRSQVVKRFNGKTGAFMGIFTTGFTLVVPAGLAFGPDGNLYVADEVNVIKFDGTTGAFISVFVAARSGGLLGPGNLIFRPDGFLYVGSAHSGVLRYDAQTGAFVSQPVPDLGIRADGGLAFGPDGNMYVAFFDFGNPTDFVNVYDPQTGALISPFFVPIGAAGVIGGIAFTPTNTQVTEVVPNHGGNAGLVTVQVIGGNFQQGAQLKLTGIGQDISGSVVPTVSPTVTAATFDLRNAAVGLRNLVINNPDGSIVEEPAAFTIEDGGGPQIWVDVVGLDRIRVGRRQNTYIVVGNSGNVDAAAVPVWFSVPSDVISNLDLNLTPVAGSDGKPILGAAADPYQVTVSGTTVSGISVGYIPSGSSFVFPISLAVGSSLDSFNLGVWAGRPWLTDLSALSATGDPDALACMEQVGEIAAQRLYGNFVNFDDATKKLFRNTLESDLVLTRTNARITFLSRGFFVYSTQSSIVDALLTTLKAAGIAVGASDGILLAVDIGAIIVDAANLSSACRNVLAKIDEQDFTKRPVTSLDPNEKAGSRGAGAQQFISSRTPLRYSIYFSNQETASAPAQQVTIKDQLDPIHDDLSTFLFGPIAFGDQLIPPSAAGQTSFSARVDLRPANSILVAITGNLNIFTGLLTWDFQSLDPSTGLPPADPTAGFLLPGDGGSTFFTIAPRRGLPTSMQIQNQATIVFDANQPIATPTWFNTLDDTPPTSQVLALPTVENSAAFMVTWSGTDVGAGVQDFMIYVADNGAPFTAFQTNTIATSAIFTGQVGHTYAFYSIARDLVGNVEPAKTTAEATTTVTADTTPPVTVASASPGPNASGWNNSDVTITLNSGDDIGGTDVKQISYSASGAQTVASTTVAGSSTSFSISIEGTTTITFFATDNAGNTETPKMITVKLDTTPPILTCSVTPSVLWPPNNKLVPVNATVTVTDSLSGSAGFNLLSVTSNERDSGQGDIQGFVQGTPSVAGQLRAQRLGSGAGRVYTFIYSGADEAGNSATCTTTVTVPHDQGH